MAKDVKLQVFLDAKQYFELLGEAQAYQITAKSGSELIRKLLYYYLDRYPILTAQLDRRNRKITELESVISDLENNMRDLKLKKLKGNRKNVKPKQRKN
jgi:hypothetical protein